MQDDINSYSQISNIKYQLIENSLIDHRLVGIRKIHQRKTDKEIRLMIDKMTEKVLAESQ